MHPTRRHALRAGVALAATALAGCTSSSSSSSTPRPSSSTSDEDSSASEAAGETGSAAATGQPRELPRAQRATLRTTKGDITVELYPEKVPVTVGNFVGLATGTKEWEDPQTGEVRNGPLYEDVPFHRIIGDFMIQGGDPTGTGRGGPGYTFDDEFHDDLSHDQPGVLSMANRGSDTNGSQFFITLSPQPHLDGRHAVFGTVVDGMNVVEEIGAVPTDENDRPLDPVVLNAIDVDE